MPITRLNRVIYQVIPPSFEVIQRSGPESVGEVARAVIGPHLEPATRSSSMTKGAVLKSAPAAHVDLGTGVTEEKSVVSQ